MPVALEETYSVSWNLSVEPSEPVPWPVNVAVSVVFRLFQLSPSQTVKCPVKLGCEESNGTNENVPV